MMTAMAASMAIILNTPLCRNRLLVVQHVARAMIVFLGTVDSKG